MMEISKELLGGTFKRIQNHERQELKVSWTSPKAYCNWFSQIVIPYFPDYVEQKLCRTWRHNSWGVKFAFSCQTMASSVTVADYCCPDSRSIPACHLLLCLSHDMYETTRKHRNLGLWKIKKAWPWTQSLLPPQPYERKGKGRVSFSNHEEKRNTRWSLLGGEFTSNWIVLFAKGMNCNASVWIKRQEVKFLLTCWLELLLLLHR